MAKNHSVCAVGSRHTPFKGPQVDYDALLSSVDSDSRLWQWDFVTSGTRADPANAYLLKSLSPLQWSQIETEYSVEGDEGGYRYILKNATCTLMSDPISLLNGGSFVCPADSYGFGRFIVSSATAGTAAEWIAVAWDSTGAPTEIGKSTNSILSNTDTYFCAYKGTGNYLVIRNRLGSVKDFIFEVHYKIL